MDSINRFGAKLYNKLLPNYFRQATNDQKYAFNFGIPQLHKNGTFNIDWRLTDDPKIHNNVMDLDFYFDVGAEMSHCVQKHDAFEY